MMHFSEQIPAVKEHVTVLPEPVIEFKKINNLSIAY